MALPENHSQLKSYFVELNHFHLKGDAWHGQTHEKEARDYSVTIERVPYP
ncbi:hypothetical protein ES708_14888 [subsurface metagenome]